MQGGLPQARLPPPPPSRAHFRCECARRRRQPPVRRRCRNAAGQPALLVVLLNTFRYSRYLLVPERNAIHMVLHADAAPRDMVQAYLQVRSRVRSQSQRVLRRWLAACARVAPVIHAGTHACVFVNRALHAARAAAIHHTQHRAWPLLTAPPCRPLCLPRRPASCASASKPGSRCRLTTCLSCASCCTTRCWPPRT